MIQSLWGGGRSLLSPPLPNTRLPSSGLRRIFHRGGHANKYVDTLSVNTRLDLKSKWLRIQQFITDQGSGKSRTLSEIRFTVFNCKIDCNIAVKNIRNRAFRRIKKKTMRKNALFLKSCIKNGWPYFFFKVNIKNVSFFPLTVGIFIFHTNS